MKKAKHLKCWHFDVSNNKNMTSRTFYGDVIIHKLYKETHAPYDDALFYENDKLQVEKMDKNKR